MIEHIVSIILAILGLGFLVFIHELGHFIIARREGMAVEVFSIGFGKPIISWVKNGVRWQVGILPFGGYVKIAGMQREGNREPYDIPSGFYSKRPIQRIRVALMGPLANVIFAVVVFFLLNLAGGRERTFSEYTHRIGWIDPQSSLYKQGVRPGDVIGKYNNHSFAGFKDLLMTSITNEDEIRIEGYKIDYQASAKKRFDYTLKTYKNPSSKENLKTIGVFTPAQYLIYDSKYNPNIDQLPMATSQIKNDDRMVWVDGEVVFSLDQLRSIINESSAFLTVQRKGEIFQTRIPRIHVDDLKMSRVQKAELDDWQHEADISGRLQDLFFIPYLLSPNAAVEQRLDFVDQKDQERAFQSCERCALFQPLQEDDQILAVDGQKVSTSYDLLQKLQERRVLLIVQRDSKAIDKILWKEADFDFDARLNPADIRQIVSSIGTSSPLTQSGNLVLLQPVVPKPINEIPVQQDVEKRLNQQMAAIQKEINSIRDPSQREAQMRALEAKQRTLVLGVVFRDRLVTYNPSTLSQFSEILRDTWHTLSGLFSGAVNPKYVSGPIGIIQVIHQSWESGIRDALFWMGVISLNLGVINLLPLPILDGGHIFFSLFEAVTKKRLSGKTMERFVIPFFVLIVAFFFFTTFHDIARIFTRFF